MNRKKAIMTAEFIVGAIILIGGFIVAVPLVTNMLGDDVSRLESVCQKSVGLRASTALKISGEELKAFPFICKTIDLDLEGNKEKMEKQISELMARCWWMFQEGRYAEIFESYPQIKKENSCFICYTAFLQESSNFKEGEDKITSQELLNYLLDKNHKFTKNQQNYLLEI